jgi:acylphosphatase
MQEFHIFVSGTVQGVGFRMAVKRCALPLNIKGYAQNLPDGRVKICAQGTQEQIRAFTQAVQEKLGPGFVSHIESTLAPMQQPFSTFEIRY